MYPIENRAQAPEPCGPEGEMQPFCEQACIICDIDGFSGINDENENGVAPPDFCTTFQHNIQWIAFIAGSEDLRLKITVGDCSWQGGSLEIGIYEGIDCDNYMQVSDCNTNIDAGSSWTFQNTVPLVVGQYYFLIMDGSGGSVCEYLIEVEEGSTNVQALEPTKPIEVPDLICANQPFSLSFEPQVGATIYEWTVDGVLTSLSQVCDLTLEDAGSYNVCVLESNACDEAEQSCTTIEVSPQVAIQKDSVICEGDTIVYKGVEYWEPGIYSDILIPAQEGCDSVFTLNLEFGAIFEGDDFYNICDGDTLFLNGQEHFETGVYDHWLLTEKGCDSIVHVNLLAVICNMEGTIAPTHLLCHGDGDVGEISFRIDAGTPPFTYDYVKVLDPDVNGIGVLLSDNEDLVLTGLPSGTYIINVYDTFGNFTILTAEILEPSPIESEILVSNYNGYNVSCFNGANATAESIANGGTPGYDHYWITNGENNPMVDGLSAGMEIVKITDANGCEHHDTIFITQPDSLQFSLDIFDPNCEGPNTGSIEVVGIQGGVADYLSAYENEPFTATGLTESLSEGSHLISVQDANGCIVEQTASLVAAEIPDIQFPDDLTVCLGDSIQIIPDINDINIASYTWTSEEYLSCLDCREPFAFPLFFDQFILSVTSLDGCTRENAINIYVDKDRKIYEPNIFSPSLNGANGYFHITGGKQLKTIASLEVYDRWGNRVFQGKELDPNVPSQGWDGSFNGHPLNPGVFTWRAEVHFLDDHIEVFAGNITLVN